MFQARELTRNAGDNFERVRDRLAGLQQALGRAESKGDKDQITELTTKIQLLQRVVEYCDVLYNNLRTQLKNIQY